MVFNPIISKLKKQGIKLTSYTFFLQHIERTIAKQRKSPTRDKQVKQILGQSRSQALSLCDVIHPSRIPRLIEDDKFHKISIQICIRKSSSYVERSNTLHADIQYVICSILISFHGVCLFSFL